MNKWGKEKKKEEDQFMRSNTLNDKTLQYLVISFKEQK